jgi:hypothetical protein
MDAITKKTLIALITIVKQLAERNHETMKLMLETIPEADALRQKLGDIDQSTAGILRRLDEVTRQVDQS